jgi:U3 small nucleolar RNA-associated protein 14
MAQDIKQLLGHIEEPEEENRDEEAPQRAKMRSVMFYQYLKQKRRAKIKSKLYHKIHKKKKEKEQQLTAPSLSEEQRVEIEEFQRAQERMSLKHTKGSKFKKLITRYAKYEGDVRNSAMQDNENLVQRIKNISRISSEGNVTYESSSSDDEAFLAETLKIDLEEPLPNKGVLGMKFMQEAMKKKRMREKEETEKLLKELKGETVEQENEDTITSKFKFDGDDSAPKKKRKTKEVREILSSKDEQQKKLIEKAFEIDEMDEVANEEWEKEDAEQKAKEPKKLKGWGSWTGSNIKTLELPPEPPKFRTEKLIVNSERDKKAAKYLVKRLPAPYKSARQYDSVHKIPLSKQLNSKRVFQQLIQPEILTRPGDIIEPLSQEFKERKVES